MLSIRDDTGETAYSDTFAVLAGADLSCFYDDSSAESGAATAVQTEASPEQPPEQTEASPEQTSEQTEAENGTAGGETPVGAIVGGTVGGAAALALLAAGALLMKRRYRIVSRRDGSVEGVVQDLGEGAADAGADLARLSGKASLDGARGFREDPAAPGPLLSKPEMPGPAAYSPYAATDGLDDAR